MSGDCRSQNERPAMKVTPTSIPDVLVLEPKVYGDERGFFFESVNQQAFRVSIQHDGLLLA